MMPPQMSYNERQPKVDYKAGRDDDDSEARKKAEAAAKAADDDDDDDGGWLRPGTTVIVSGLVKAARHNGKNARVIHYDGHTQRYALQLEDGERVKVKPSCVLEDITDEACDDDGYADASDIPCKDAAEAKKTEGPTAAAGDSAAAGRVLKPGDAGYNHRTDYDRFEKLALAQHDIDEDLMRCMNKMYLVY